MIISKASIVDNSLKLHCKVLIQEENQELYFADATYSIDEVLISKSNAITMLINTQRIIGTQLSLFT